MHQILSTAPLAPLPRWKRAWIIVCGAHSLAFVRIEPARDTASAWAAHGETVKLYYLGDFKPGELFSDRDPREVWTK